MPIYCRNKMYHNAQPENIFHFDGFCELRCTFIVIFSFSMKSCFSENPQLYFKTLDYTKQNKTTPN
jgi:hypothetical protein